MQKKRSHYLLERVKELVREGQHSITSSSLRTAYEDFGFLEPEMLETVLKLSPKDFYKSMTSHFDHSIGRMSITRPLVIQVAI